MMPTSLTLPAPAKLNLLLHITGRRPDGYHELQTLFQFLALADTLTFTLTDDGQARLANSLPDVKDSDNLVLRAARLLEPLRPNPQQGIHIQLGKHLPMGGGLGAGSSDAATTLLALNHLWQLNLPHTQLLQLGLQLGADVPIFILGQTAWAEGVGEQLTPTPMPEAPYLLVHPGCHCNTGLLFSHPQLPRNTPRIQPADALQYLGDNDFAALVRQLYPPVQAVFDWLSAAGLQPHLTGSGACVYARLPDTATGEQVLQRLPEQLAGSPIRGWLTHSLNTSPAHQQLNALKGSLLHSASL